jgi:K(+)-stimulated pyrophosphate-energized sodium pump
MCCYLYRSILKENDGTGCYRITSPIIIGFVFGPEVLGGFLAGATVCGVTVGKFPEQCCAVHGTMLQKYFEKGVEINGELFYKNQNHTKHL